MSNYSNKFEKRNLMYVTKGRSTAPKLVLTNEEINEFCQSESYELTETFFSPPELYISEGEEGFLEFETYQSFKKFFEDYASANKVSPNNCLFQQNIFDGFLSFEERKINVLKELAERNHYTLESIDVFSTQDGCRVWSINELIQDIDNLDYYYFELESNGYSVAKNAAGEYVGEYGDFADFELEQLYFQLKNEANETVTPLLSEKSMFEYLYLLENESATLKPSETNLSLNRFEEVVFPTTAIRRTNFAKEESENEHRTIICLNDGRDAFSLGNIFEVLYEIDGFRYFTRHNLPYINSTELNNEEMNRLIYALQLKGFSIFVKLGCETSRWQFLSINAVFNNQEHLFMKKDYSYYREDKPIFDIYTATGELVFHSIPEDELVVRMILLFYGY